MAERRRPTTSTIIPAQALDAVQVLRNQLQGSGGSGGSADTNGSADPNAPQGASSNTQVTSTASDPSSGSQPSQPSQTSQTSPSTPSKPPATETIARRTGAMVDEIDFPKFVASLVHGTFDAVVDASIRQMESYASLVAAVAKTVDQFTEENVTPNQARDWLAQRFPGDIKLVLGAADAPEPHLEPRSDGLTPAWLADYGVDGQDLTSDLLEQTIVPQVRSKIGAERQQLLATMVLLGMNRVVVKDGTINAKVMFRAAADDLAQVGYAVGADPQSTGSWGERGSLSYAGASTKVSTLSINAQSESAINTQLYGEVRLNFASETLPLEKMADAAKVALVQRNSPVGRSASATPPAAPPGTTAPPPPAVAAAPAPATRSP